MKRLLLILALVLPCAAQSTYSGGSSHGTMQTVPYAHSVTLTWTLSTDSTPWFQAIGRGTTSGNGWVGAYTSRLRTGARYVAHIGKPN